VPYVGTSTSTTNFNKTVHELIQRTLYTLLRAGLEHLPRGSIKQASFMGKNSGGSGVFRFNNVKDLDATPASHTLTEGVPPTGQELSMGYEEFTAAQYGDFVRLTDATILKNPQSIAATAAERVVRQMALVADNIAKAAIAAGTNVIYAGTGNVARTDVAAGDILTSVLIKRGAALLGGTDVARIDGSYLGIIHPYVKFDLELDEEVGGWIDTNRYAGSKQLFTGELGTYAGVRFVGTSNAYVAAAGGAGSADVYSTTLLGAEAIAVGDLSTQETIVERGGVSDPLHQVETVGWKMWLGACLVGEGTNATNASEPRYVRIESASSI
jgi:N4-gp56 family major capsid protein